MNCLLCGVNEATKSNTHYLTDSIIRPALNVDGKGERDIGLYWILSTGRAGLEFGFQQSTSVAKLEEILGRPATDEEIAASIAETAFSVDDHFCPPCEDHFGKIEEPFTREILPRFRGADLTGIQEISIEEVRLFRAFFLLQVYRSAVCDEMFNLPEETLVDLRHLILNFLTVDIAELTKYPLTVTYLQTTGGPVAYTENQVGFAVNDESQIILMNDFVIQFFESKENVKCIDFNGLNDPSDFEDYLNANETVFQVKVLSNKQRREFSYPGYQVFSDKIKAYFQAKHIKRFRQPANPRIVGHFMYLLSDETVDIPLGVRYGEERLEVIANTILEKIASETAKHRHRRK